MTSFARRSSIAASAALVLLGSGAVIGGSAYGIFDDRGRIAAGFLPVLCGAAIVVLGLLDLVLQILRKSEGETIADEIIESVADGAPLRSIDFAAQPDIDIFGRNQRTRNRQLLTVVVALIASMMLVPVLGLLLALALLMVFVSIFVEKRGVLPTVAITVIASAVFYVAFVVLLRVPMPRGLLGVI